MLRKINFLKKIKAPNEIAISYLKFLFFSRLTKFQRALYKKKHLNFLKNKKISSDWFSKNCFFFSYVRRKIKKNFTYLEIGSFEGNSLLYVLNFLRPKLAYAVDTWEGSDEHAKLNMNSIESNFNYNLKNYQDKFVKCKTTSGKFFKNNKIFFDFIYIDGNHEFNAVLKDSINSWKFLNIGGVIAFDDYFWQYYQDIYKNPGYAINNFLRIIKNKYKVILLTNSQLFIQKI
jgi:predicted O-methyltransferase YrrM